MSPQKFSEPYDNPFWGLSNGGAKRKKKINLPNLPLGPIAKNSGLHKFAPLVKNTMVGPKYLKIVAYLGLLCWPTYRVAKR